jgi:predicted ATPase
MQDSVMDHSKAISQCKHQITRICLTGGPCAGKTTAFTEIAERLIEKGFKVFMVPEAATLMMKGGCFIQTKKMTFADGVKFQINLMKAQMILEDVFLETALNADQKAVIICDRGVMDGQAYVTEQVWQALLDETAWSTIQLRDRRYEGVVHMETAANGAEKFYTGENNVARYESVEEARVLDRKLIDAWTGHPHFFLIDNA